MLAVIALLDQVADSDLLLVRDERALIEKDRVPPRRDDQFFGRNRRDLLHLGLRGDARLAVDHEFAGIVGPLAVAQILDFRALILPFHVHLHHLVGG